jgi:hypothetical protein
MAFRIRYFNSRMGLKLEEMFTIVRTLTNIGTPPMSVVVGTCNWIHLDGSIQMNVCMNVNMVRANGVHVVPGSDDQVKYGDADRRIRLHLGAIASGNESPHNNKTMNNRVPRVWRKPYHDHRIETV